MAFKTTLKALFAGILVSMILCTGFAWRHQSMFQWGGLTTGRDRYWTIATMFDAYFGFLTFYVWVFYKERHRVSQAAWFIAIMTLGNMAMATYVLVQLARLQKNEPASTILSIRNG